MWLRHEIIGSCWRVCLLPIAVATMTAATANAELVLRLDASNLSTLGLSTDMTTGTISGFPDARQVGLKFVESWGQTYGATANPLLHRPLAYIGNPLLGRPTYDPNGLGTGKPSVNFDYIQGDIVLGAGQRLATGLDNFINSADFTIFFVASGIDTRFQFAFGQDLDYRPGGWGMALDEAGDEELYLRWSGRLGGYASDPDALGTVGAPQGVSDITAVHALVGTAAGNLEFESRESGSVVVNTTERLEHGIWGGGDFVVGNRAGKDTTVGTRPFNGRIGEVAIFNHELNATERDAVRAYLENKWAGGPAPTGPQLALANSLLQQAAPTGKQNIARYEFFKENVAAPDLTMLEPDWVATGVTASNFGGGGGFQSGEDGSFGVSNVGISARSVYLGQLWADNIEEQSPVNESPFYLGFTVTPEAGKEIDPAELSFALARGETVAQAINGADSYGVWIDRGNGFVKVGGEVSLGNPPNGDEIVPFFFHTVNVDLSSVSPFTGETEIRIYLWHEGPLVDPDPVVQYSARIDNVRLLGMVQDAGSGGLAGDYNDDGVVDAADYVVWRRNENTQNSLPNDPLGGTIDHRQYNQWKENFGMSAGSGSLSSVVPEPATFSLAYLIGLALCSWRRRSS